MSKLVNLTPHDCNIYREADDVHLLTVPASGKLARRIEMLQHYPIEINGVEVDTASKIFMEIEGLPEQIEGTIYFVSAVVATAAWEQGRTDVVCPLKGKRDEQGHIVGTYGLSVHPSLRQKQ